MARCPAGKQVLGGGFSSAGGTLSLVGSFPVFVAIPTVDTRTTPGWLISARNMNGTDATLTAYAICATAN